MEMSRPESTPELVNTLAGYARLPLPEERVESVGAAIQLVNGLIDQLDAIDLGDTPPATAFDARWS